MARGAFCCKSSLKKWSKSLESTVESALATPISLQNALIASGVKPLRLTPDIVGIRGSSHPSVTPSSTNNFNFLLLITVFVKLSLANSICLGTLSISHSLTTQS